MKKYISLSNVILFGIIILSSFIRLFRLPDLMIFGGDVARDYFSAANISYNGIIPLLGSPSSVPWLHQGALFTYILGFVLWVGDYNPLIGGYFVGIMGVFGVFAVYLAGKHFFSKKVGLVSAFFYSTSPLVVIFDRYPYHQSIISLFTICFFLSLFFAIKKNIKLFVLSSFIFGLLMQLELSNLVFLPVLGILFYDYKKNISFKILLLSIFSFLITWTPKIIYDFSNGFTQTIGFAAWILHKIIPLSVWSDGLSSNLDIFARFNLVFDFFVRMTFWPSTFVSLIIFACVVYGLSINFRFKDRKINTGKYLLFLWLTIPVLCFLVQGSPSGAYAPAVFALPSLLIGLFFEKVTSLKKYLLLLIIFLGFFNGYFLIKNDYFMLTENKGNSRYKGSFNMGQSYKLVKEVAIYLVDDAKGSPYNLIPLSSYSVFPSAKLDLYYLTWYFGNQPSEDKQKLKYYIYGRDDIIKTGEDWEIKTFPYLVVAKKISKE